MFMYNGTSLLSIHTHTDCFISGSKDQQIVIYPADVVLFEGILVFYFPSVRKLFHMKLFVDMDSDMRLADRG